MSDVTRLLCAIESGELHAAEQLLPLVYTELRQLATRQMAREKPGQTLNATALVHEAYLRLVDQSHPQLFANRRHFFAAAAEAMRRILIDNARRKHRLKHGGDLQRVELADELLPFEHDDSEIVAVHEALDEFAQHDPDTAELVKLHFFAGITIDDAADVLGISPRSAYRNWSYARAWLFRYLEQGAAPKSQ